MPEIEYIKVGNLIRQAQRKADQGHTEIVVYLAWSYGTEANLLALAGGTRHEEESGAWIKPKPWTVDPARVAQVLRRYLEWITYESDLEASPLRSHFDLFTPIHCYSDRQKKAKRQKSYR